MCNNGETEVGLLALKHKAVTVELSLLFKKKCMYTYLGWFGVQLSMTILKGPQLLVVEAANTAVKKNP